VLASDVWCGVLPRSSLAGGGVTCEHCWRQGAGAGVPFSDLLQRSGTLGEPLADGLGCQRAGGFGAQPGDFGGQGGDVLAGAGCLGSARVHFGRVADVNALAI
jgi:hypothetical protein